MHKNANVLSRLLTRCFPGLCLLMLAAVSCASTQNQINPQTQIEAGKTGVFVSAATQEMQFLLANSGAVVLLDKENMGMVPFGSSRFIELEQGKHEIYMYFRYTGINGEVRKCFTLEDGQLLHAAYKTPFVVLDPGTLRITDVVDPGRSIDYSRGGCP